MREIKFRGKDYLTNKWIYGGIDLFCLPQWGFIICDGNYEVVKENTIGQFTGLKDKNEVEIYEGDIVYVALEDENATIEWDEKTVRFILSFDDWISDFDSYYGENLEVISNIYETPELAREG